MRLLAVTGLLGVVLVAAGGAEQKPPGIIPVVGHWESVVDDGAPAVIADARQWDGRSGPDLAAVSRQLFSALQPDFTANMDPATAFPFAVVAGVDDFTGGTLRGRFKLVAGESDQIAGFAFGLRPNGDYFYVRYNTKDGNLAVWEFTGGKRNVLEHGEHHAQLVLGEWYELMIRVKGRHVRGEMLGRFIVEHDLPRGVDGPIGLWTKRDAVTAFRLPLVVPALD
jgi:hypothetical protein